MILRRIASALQRQDWSTVAVEIIIVVLGVFIGLQVNNWNAARSERAQLEQQLVSLRYEMEENLQRFAERKALSQSQLESIKVLRSAFASNSPDAISDDIDGRLMNIFRVGAWRPEVSAFSELAETGGMRRLGDSSLRTKLRDWEAAVTGVARLDEDALTFRASAVDYLMGTIAFAPMVGHHPASEGNISGTHFLNKPDVLAKERALDNYLALRFAIEAQISFELDKLEKVTLSVIAMLETRESG